MKINYIPLNKGETYCCSLKKVKVLFKNTSVVLSFTHGDTVFRKALHHPVYRYVNKYVKGKVLVYVQCYSGQSDPLICFFRLKTEDYSNDLIEQFEEFYLQQIYNFYLNQLNNQDISGKRKLMVIELIDGKFKLHETTLD